MVWLTWRQHRAELAAVAIVVLAATAWLILTGASIHHAYASTGVPGCLANSDNERCMRIIIAFTETYSGRADGLIAIRLLPALLGAFIGAPLLARELERGTWKLAFTQTVTRTRWLATKLTVVMLAVVALMAMLTFALTWWRAPLDAVGGRLAPAFELEGLSLATTALFALAIGALAGALVRRVVPAMALTLAAYVAIRLPIGHFLRPRYQAPLVASPSAPNQAILGTQPNQTEWILHRGYLDNTGQRMPTERAMAIARPYLDQPHPEGPDINGYLNTLGVREYVEYQPDSRFWTFQLVEAGLFLALAGVAIVGTLWLLRRRTS